ncbi:MAG TPA: ribosome silencing factor [Bacillota bacterium]|nr:ribosome silencing factor [Bacillota bacterium]
MTDQEILTLAWEAALEKKAQEPVLLDLRNISRIADYFLVLSAENTVQVKAIADNIDEKMMENGVKALRREGYQAGCWILLDYGFLVVHALHKQERDFYQLEQLWHDAKPIKLTQE